MKRCDVCQKEVDTLFNIDREYATADLTHICGSCDEVVQTAFAAATRKIHTLVRVAKKSVWRQFVAKLQQGESPPEVKRG